VHVFDGKPPNLKAGRLAKRAERRDEAQNFCKFLRRKMVMVKYIYIYIYDFYFVFCNYF